MFILFEFSPKKKKKRRKEKPEQQSKRPVGHGSRSFVVSSTSLSSGFIKSFFSILFFFTKKKHKEKNKREREKEKERTTPEKQKRIVPLFRPPPFFVCKKPYLHKKVLFFNSLFLVVVWLFFWGGFEYFLSFFLLERRELFRELFVFVFHFLHFLHFSAKIVLFSNFVFTFGRPFFCFLISKR